MSWRASELTQSEECLGKSLCAKIISKGVEGDSRVVFQRDLNSLPQRKRLKNLLPFNK